MTDPNTTRPIIMKSIIQPIINSIIAQYAPPVTVTDNVIHSPDNVIHSLDNVIHTS